MNDPISTVDSEYIILENIYDSGRQASPLRQRDLAHIAGASLGMTNSILKRLAQKGWITVKRLNRRNIQYAITLEGMNEIIRRSYRYFKRTIKNIVYYKDILEDIIKKAKRENIDTVILAGPSDLDFIIEHACEQWDLNFIKISNIIQEGSANAFTIYSESITAMIEENQEQNVFYLSRLIMRQAPLEIDRKCPV
jgi:DNA-binding MarR family transcriptional regulator